MSPIKPENKQCYPNNWPEIRERIRIRAKDKCEWCGLRNHSVGYRNEEGRFYGTGGNIFDDLAGDGLSYPSLQTLSFMEAREIAEACNDQWGDEHYIVIVCTVAHLDHTPENCSDENLAFLCQKCHNNYDKGHRKQTIKNNGLIGQMRLFNYKTNDVSDAHEIVKALSWKEPFASLMLHGKIEPRTWKTNYRGLVLICTSQKPYSYREVERIAGKIQNERILEISASINFIYGYAIATGRLIDCRPMQPEDENKCFVKYNPELYCHVYENVKAIRPFAWKGKRGWTAWK